MTDAPRIATFNVNGVIGRLPRLLHWLEETQPNAACLQELKAPDEKFPAKTLEKACEHGSRCATRWAD